MPTSASESTEISLGAMQEVLHRVLKALVFRGDPSSPLNEYPISQLTCLYCVAEKEGQKMLDVCKRMEIKVPAMSRIVDRLVKRGMLERMPDTTDRRVVRLALTAEAQEIMSAAQADRVARMSATFDRLTLDGKQSVYEGLDHLAIAAEAVEAAERLLRTPSHLQADPDVELISRKARRSRRLQVGVGVSPIPAANSPLE